MATFAQADGEFSGRPTFWLRADMTWLQTDFANNRTLWRWSLQVVNSTQTSQTWNADPHPYSMVVNGQIVADASAAVLDFRDGALSHAIAEGQIWVPHNSDGNKTISFTGQMVTSSIFGNATASGSVAAPNAGTVPPAPDPLRLDQITSSSMRYAFQSTGTGGPPIIRWEFQYSTSSNFSSGNSGLITSTGTSTVTGLNRATRYYFRSRGVNSKGAGPWSSIISATTLATVPGQVAVPTATGSTTSSVSYSWNAPDSGGSSITTYNHQVATSSSFSNVVRSFNDSASPTSVGGLEPGTTYYVRVRAVNSVGAGSWSSPRAITTDATVPGTPPRPALTGTTSTSISFTRSAPSTDGGSNITTYNFQLATNSSFTTGLQSWSSTSASQTRSGLTRNETYYIRVRAVNAIGASPWSATLTATTEASPPSQPPIPVLVSARATSIVFTRGTPSDNGGAAISTYEFQSATNSSFTSGVRTWRSANTTQTATPLVPDTAYYIRYRAINSAGNSPWSPTLTVSTLATGAPTLAMTTEADGMGAQAVITPPSSIRSSVTEMRLQYRLLGSSTITTVDDDSEIALDYGFVRSGTLRPGARYQWRAAYFVGSYLSPYSEWQTITQPQPNTDPGDYFDGSFPARGDLTFSFTGTQHLSTSLATGVQPEGWSVLQNFSGGELRLQRVSGGRTGGRAARMLVIADTTAHRAHIGSRGTGVGAAVVAEGGTYFASIYVRPSRPQRLQCEVRFLTADGSTTVGVSSGDAVIAQPGRWTRLIVSATAPVGAASAGVYAQDVSGDGWSPWLGGEFLDADDAMLTVGQLYPWFYGNTPDTATYLYDWLGATNASVSRRSPNPNLPPDPLADPDCPPIPGAPQPPTIDDSCIEDVEEWRRYWAIIPDGEVDEWLSVVPTITIRTGAEEARQVRIRFYPNPLNVIPDSTTSLEVESEQTISYIPAFTTFTLDGVARRAWAEVGSDGIQRPADHMLYGPDGGPATWPTLSCGAPYLISFDVPLESAEGAFSVGVQLTTRMM